MKNETEYTTKDFYLSACLLAIGIRPELRKISDRTFLFAFPNSQGRIEKLLEKHWNRKLLIPSKDLVEAISELKTRIYDGH
jgi:hypothetical protein